MDRPPLPVSRDGFEYYDNGFYAVVHPNHRHRRSSIPELRAIFNSTSKKTSIKDKPAHWYRAQLIHYGLQPTDIKGTAAMRLLDVLNRDALKVPGSVQRLERALKKEYNDQKKIAKEKRAFSAKRKAPSKQKEAQPKKNVQPKSPATKKRLRDFADLDDNEELSGIVSQAVESSKNSGGRGISISNLNVNVNIGGLGGPRKSAKKTSTTRVKPEPVAEQEMFNRPSQAGRPGSSRDMPLCRPRPTLGLLNGIYKIDSYILDTFDSNIIFCLDDRSLWGRFQLGCVEGILYIAERPWSVSYEDGDGCPFLWRTRDVDTGLGLRGEQHSGNMRFLGDGHINGIFYNLPDGEGGWLDFNWRKAETDTERTVQKTLGELLEIPAEDISLDDSIFDLGVSSFNLILLRSMIQKVVDAKVDIPMSIMLTEPTVGAIAASIDSLLSQPPVYTALVPLQPHNNPGNTPLFCIHPGSGDILVFIALAAHFPTRGYNPNERFFHSIAETAETYASQIRQTQPIDPYGKTSGRPTMFKANKLCGYESIVLCQGYNPTFRRYRKFLHQELGTKVSAAEFRGVQEIEVRRQLVRALNEPGKWLEHFKP
ncbi:hypothetical protein N8T08_004892 [Aspergillus melleus]|uniref:Uncharacterized protein n=1 Tax=Aspergillus melleus TaxID=138277 RepID=A0ACC3B3W8_9EURO|nr:hypothetical protein N8T08_004892 [Aspergillus melleus]